MLAQTRAMAREARAVSIPSAQAGVSAKAVFALARIEARRILLHPGFLGASGLFMLFILVAVGGGGIFVAAGPDSPEIKWGFVVVGLSVGVAAGGLIASNLGAQRPRRDRMLELYGSLPSPPETRTAAVTAGALLGPVLLATLLAAIIAPLLRSDPNVGRYVHFSLVVQFPLMIVAFCAIGIGLARWVPGVMTGPVALIAQVMTPIVWAAPWIVPSESGVRMPWHFAYVIAVIVLWCALAFLRDRPTWIRGSITIVALVVASYAVVHQYPPGGLSL